MHGVCVWDMCCVCGTRVYVTLFPYHACTVKCLQLFLVCLTHVDA